MSGSQKKNIPSKRVRLHLSPEQAALISRLWNEHAGALHALLIRAAGNEADASDLLQELFRRLAANPEKLAGFENPRAFLCVCARRLAIDHGRRKSAERRQQEEIAKSPTTPTFFEEEVTDAALRKAIEEAFQALPPEQRVVAEEKLIKGKTLQAIADDLGLPLNTVSSRLRYSLDKIRAQLRPYYDDMKTSHSQKLISAPSVSQDASNELPSQERLIQPLEPKRVPSIAPGLEGLAALAPDDSVDEAPIDEGELADEAYFEASLDEATDEIGEADYSEEDGWFWDASFDGEFADEDTEDWGDYSDEDGWIWDASFDGEFAFEDTEDWGDYSEEDGWIWDDSFDGEFTDGSNLEDMPSVIRGGFGPWESFSGDELAIWESEEFSDWDYYSEDYYFDEFSSEEYWASFDTEDFFWDVYAEEGDWSDYSDEDYADYSFEDSSVPYELTDAFEIQTPDDNALDVSDLGSLIADGEIQIDGLAAAEVPASVADIADGDLLTDLDIAVPLPTADLQPLSGLHFEPFVVHSTAGSSSLIDAPEPEQIVSTGPTDADYIPESHASAALISDTATGTTEGDNIALDDPSGEAQGVPVTGLLAVGAATQLPAGTKKVAL